jgi:hypothetical protein
MMLLMNSPIKAYNHVKNGRAIKAIMQAYEQCPAKLSIFVPMDESDRRAIVTVGTLPHNHPIPPSAKVPFEVQKQYSACIVANGVIGATPLRIDRGKSCNFGNIIFIANNITAQQTKTILGGRLPQELHPALNDNWKRARIIKSEKVKSYPEGGSSLSGMFFVRVCLVCDTF